MAQQTSLPEITVAERDRRHGVFREHLREQGADCVIVSGSNLFYLTNGLPGERFGVLPGRRQAYDRVHPRQASGGCARFRSGRRSGLGEARSRR